MRKAAIAITTLFLGVAAVGARAGAPETRTVNLRGPREPDCEWERGRARARNDASALFLAEIKCRVAPAWKCATACKGDELLVTHVRTRIAGNGQPADMQVVQKSESAAYDTLCSNALKAAAPFPAPPKPMTDAAGAASVLIEFVCDCVERPKAP